MFSPFCDQPKYTPDINFFGNYILVYYIIYSFTILYIFAHYFIYVSLLFFISWHTILYILILFYIFSRTILYTFVYYIICVFTYFLTINLCVQFSIIEDKEGANIYTIREIYIKYSYICYTYLECALQNMYVYNGTLSTNQLYVDKGVCFCNNYVKICQTLMRLTYNCFRTLNFL